jgi:hypothetical protein
MSEKEYFVQSIPASELFLVPGRLLHQKFTPALDNMIRKGDILQIPDQEWLVCKMSFWHQPFPSETGKCQ